MVHVSFNFGLTIQHILFYLSKITKVQQIQYFVHKQFEILYVCTVDYWCLLIAVLIKSICFIKVWTFWAEYPWVWCKISFILPKFLSFFLSWWTIWVCLSDYLFFEIERPQCNVTFFFFFINESLFGFCHNFCCTQNGWIRHRFNTRLFHISPNVGSYTCDLPFNSRFLSA